MKKQSKILSLTILIVISTTTYAQKTEEYIPPGGARLMVETHDKDTVLLAFIHDVYVFPRQRFKNKTQEQFFWRTVRDVKKTLPYAKMVASEIAKTNQKLIGLSNDKERKKYLNQFEKEIFNRYEDELKKMSINQGRLLLKLIDRECEQSSYDLLKIYRGSLSAFFWQGVARVFGSNLKVNYDATNKDKIIERVVILVEAGQL